MVTFTINIPQMLAYIPYMDPMGNIWKMKKCSKPPISFKIHKTSDPGHFCSSSGLTRIVTEAPILGSQIPRKRKET
jgi:hypothetical protein